MIKTGVIHGRFQLVHNDHMKYLLAGKERCKHLVVGITNPDPEKTRPEAADPARSEATANPFTYYERYCMVRAALTGEGVDLEEFSIVPFPINLPKLYKYYVPLDGTFFMTIYDNWGEKKRRMFEALGLTIEVLWQRPLSLKGLSSTDIRRKIISLEPWEHLVPRAIVQVMEALDLIKRLQSE
ncbi:MAG: nicotinate-nucleotide adenylyltransferase [Thermodesulfobacteriota bacterium]|nr:nicotinate-nucleotide adenylyltransferase [Thermodesulfobacteriota bacterium]